MPALPETDRPGLGQAQPSRVFEFRTRRLNVGFGSRSTYIWTVEGWLYVAAVIDLFSRRVVGWELSSRQWSAAHPCHQRPGVQLKASRWPSTI